jgi:membrane-bound metal-dependent hydrolase YbcI (DUF457 family)
MRNRLPNGWLKPRARVSSVLYAAVALATWFASVYLQGRVAGLAWAVLDVLAHGALAAFVVAWLVPGWGWQPFLIAIAAAILIDLDHVVAARTLRPADLMGLGARPYTHSLVGVLGFTTLAVGAGGLRSGYVVALGLLAHLLQDGREPPGVPLFVPVVADRHVLLSDAMLPIGIVALVCVSMWLARAPVSESVSRSAFRRPVSRDV